MKIKEKQLFKQLCKFKDEDFDEGLLKYATPEVLGQLFCNRMSGIAYTVLRKHGCLAKVNREFRNSLAMSHEHNYVKNRSYLYCVHYITNLLALCDAPVAMLKGALLCAVYPDGCRTSNDIDLLCLQKDVTKIGNLLVANGFEQGYLRGGEFTPASRKEIIESKMLRGETVPYVKEMNLPGMEYLEIDINFALDYKNGDQMPLRAMLEREYCRHVKDIDIRTLSSDDFFIHLCAHLYKEATTLPWIKMKRDMTMYKYSDIYMLLSDMNSELFEDIMARAKELEQEKVVAFAVLQTIELFDMDMPDMADISMAVLKDCPSFLYRVVAPQEKKVYEYTTCDVTKRFFMGDRTANLKEVVNSGKS